MNHHSAENRESPHKEGAHFEFENFTIHKLTENHYTIPISESQMRIPVNSFFYLSQGDIFIEIEGDSMLLTAGEMILIPAYVPISIKHYNQTRGYMGAFNSNLIASFPDEKRHNINNLHHYSSIKFESLKGEAQRIERLFENLLSIYTSKNSSSIIGCYLNCLLEELEACGTNSLNINSSNNITHGFLAQLFKRESIGLKPTDYAQQLCVSINHLNKTIRRTTNKTVSQWIEERLIVNAKIMLCNTNLSVAEIAFRLGINDQSYFARKFKQQVGISASDYRTEAKGAHKPHD